MCDNYENLDLHSRYNIITELYQTMETLEEYDSKNVLESVKSNSLIMIDLLNNACAKSNVSIVKMLLSSGIDLNTLGSYGSFPLKWACYGGNLEIVKLLVEHGADINMTDHAGNTALHGTGNEDIFDFLLQKGANPLVMNSFCEYPIFKFVSTFSSDKFEHLLNDIYHNFINHQDNLGFTLLHITAMTEDIEKTKILLKMGANPNIEDMDNSTPLHYASVHYSSECRDLLLQYGANDTIVNLDNQTPILIYETRLLSV